MWRQWLDPDNTFNEARWVFLSNWPTWAYFIFALASALIIFFAVRAARRLERRRRWVLIGLRLSIVAVTWVLLLQPGVRLEHVSRVRNHIPVMVDTSRSMGLPSDQASENRLDAAKRMLKAEAPLLESWTSDHQIDFYSVSDRARPINDIDEVDAVGEASRILGALDELAMRFESSDLGAVVIVSDGADTDRLSTAADVEQPNAEIQQVIRRLGVPVHTIFTGPTNAPADVAITSVAHDDFAFVRNAVSIDVRIRVTGYENLNLPVTLRQGTQILGTRVLALKKGQTDYPFEFEFVPDQTGKSIFTLDIPPATDERVLVNNRYQFTMRIIRDKIRVLQVVGRPSWDERYLRKLLKKNPNIDLISFFILRTPDSIDPARKNELSLIPFPTRELFEEQLGSFDLVIFQNFTYRGFNMRQYLPRIRDYVKNGGGFIMLGGDLSFANGGYSGTPIESILPVTLDAQRSNPHLGRFKPRLTTVGRYHPVTRLTPVPEENEQMWTDLPALSGMNATGGLQPGATALLTHPTIQIDGQPAPVVATREVGRGRVVSVTTDSTWFWDFIASGEGGDNRQYYKFWGNMMRWLIRDPSLKPLRVTVDRDRYALGVPVSVMVKVQGKDYTPAKDADVTLTFLPEDADAARTKRDLQQGDNPPVQQTGKTNANGEFLSRFIPPHDGAWTVRAQSDATGPLEDQDVLVVATDPVELREVAARSGPLRLISETSGGVFRTVSKGLDGLARIKPKVLKVNRRKDVAVWSSAWLML
ncbi:MAG: glutamine amidotransferase, partial [Myxococcota bacterium]|nr:glutamine amidotransferase [Myxococcota bacterium]